MTLPIFAQNGCHKKFSLRLCSNIEKQNMNLPVDSTTLLFQKEEISDLRDLVDDDGYWASDCDNISDRELNQYILYGFVQLMEYESIEYDYYTKLMQIKALGGIDDSIVKDYESVLENSDNVKSVSNIGDPQIEYLFVRSFYRDIPIGHEARTAERYFTTLAEENWKELTDYQLSLLAIIAVRNGDKTLNIRILDFLREKQN